MLYNIKKPIVPKAAVGAVVLATAVCLLSSSSFAEKQNAKIKSFSFSASQAIAGQAVNIISTNGERWDKIAPGSIQLNIKARMRMRGLVLSSGLFLGPCSKTLCGGNPLIKARGSLPFNPTQFDTSKIVVSGAGISPVPYGDQMVRACNQYLTDGPREAHSFTWPITVTLSVDTRRWKPKFVGAIGPEYGGGDVSRQSTFRIKVNCIPYASLIRGAAPVEVKLNVEPRSGNACPRNTKIKTRIAYHYKKTATFDIMRNGKKIKTVEVKTKRVKLTHGPDKWVINREDVVKAEAGQNRFRIKVRGGGKSQIKTANIECAPFQVMSAKLQYNVAGSSSCPKKVWETTTFTANGPDILVYQLVRESDGFITRESSLKPIFKNDMYKLVGQRVLTINKSIDQRFRVQVKGQTGINSSWARLKVDCPKPSDGAAKDLKTAPNPTHAGKKKPRIKTAPVPKKPGRNLTHITCKRGKVRAGKCYCGAKRKRVRTGKRSYICKIKPRIKTAPLRKKPKVTRVSCRGGVVRANRCKCPTRAKRISLGSNKYRCVRKITKPKKNKNVRRINPRKRKIGKRCGRRKVLVRGRCIRPAG